VTTKKKQYNLPTLTYQIMKTAFLTLLGTSAVMGSQVLDDGQSLNIYTSDRQQPIGKLKGVAGDVPTLLDADGAPLNNPDVSVSCETHDSSTTRLVTSGRPAPADFRGKHVLQCTLGGANLVDTPTDPRVLVETEGSCAARTFPLKDTASTVQADGKFDFQPLAPVDACSDGRLKSEAQPTQVKVTMKGDVKNKYDNYKTAADMVHTYDLSNLAAHTFNIGIQNPRAAYLEVEGCQDDALCIGGASYEFLDSSGGRVHIASQNSSVGFTFEGTDYKYTKPGIQVSELNPYLEKGDRLSSAVFELIQDGNRTLTLDENIDCVFAAGLQSGVSRLIPLSDLFPLTTTQNILDACTARMVSTVEITCPDKMVPNLGPFQYDKADDEFRSAPSGYDTNQAQDHAVSNDDVSTESTVVTVAKPVDRANLVLNDPSGVVVLSVADAGDNWLVEMSHGIGFGGDGSDVEKTITVSGSYFDRCNEAAAIPLSYDVAITFKSIPVWKTPVLQVASRDPASGFSVRQRFMKWEITNDGEVQGAAFEKPAGAFWCADGNDDINTCHDGARNNNELYLYLQGTTGCEGLPRDAIARRIEFTVLNADVFGSSALPCPPPQNAVTLDAIHLDWDVEFTVDGTNTDIVLSTGHLMTGHDIKSKQAFLGASNACSADGHVTDPTNTDCELVIDGGDNNAVYTDRSTSFETCGNFLINHVEFEDNRQDDSSVTGAGSVEEFCNIKQLSIGILAQSATKTARFTAIQTGGVEADLKLTKFAWESCGNGEHRQVMDFSYDQRGTSNAAPSVTERQDDLFKLINTDVSSGIQFGTVCKNICDGGVTDYDTEIVTGITLTWSATATSVFSQTTYTISTHMTDNPCDDNIDADDSSLLTPFDLRVEKRDGACAAELANTNEITEDLRQGDVVCIQFVGTKANDGIDRELKITDVKLQDDHSPPNIYGLDSGDLTVGADKGYDLHATKEIANDMVEKTFTLTVSYEESYGFVRRRLRSDYKLGNKLHDADASFTVLPSHITVQDSVEESAPDAAPDAADAAEGTAVTDADPSWIQVTTLALVAVLVLAVLYRMIKRASGDAMERQQVMSRVMGAKAYTPVGRFTSTIQY
jgi:hypothetical protein